jgi:putative membrane protein
MWIVGPLMMLLFWGALIWLFATLVRGERRVEPPARESAVEIARRRFAAGEITEQEYERLIGRLTSTTTGHEVSGGHS